MSVALPAMSSLVEPSSPRGRHGNGAVQIVLYDDDRLFASSNGSAGEPGVSGGRADSQIISVSVSDVLLTWA